MIYVCNTKQIVIFKLCNFVFFWLISYYSMSMLILLKFGLLPILPVCSFLFTGLTPASEELQKLQEDGEDPGDPDAEGGDESSEEFYEVVDDGNGQPASSKDDDDLGLD